MAFKTAFNLMLNSIREPSTFQPGDTLIVSTFAATPAGWLDTRPYIIAYEGLVGTNNLVRLEAPAIAIIVDVVCAIDDNGYVINNNEITRWYYCLVKGKLVRLLLNIAWLNSGIVTKV